MTKSPTSEPLSAQELDELNDEMVLLFYGNKSGFSWRSIGRVQRLIAQSRQASSTTTCFECAAELHGPFCPACNPEIGRQASSEVDREAVARIIDPSSWRVMDSYLAEVERKYKGQDAAYDPDAFKDKASLAKADLILALRQVERSAVVYAAERYREAHAAAHEASMTRVIGDQASTAHAVALADEERGRADELLNAALLQPIPTKGEWPERAGDLVWLNRCRDGHLKDLHIDRIIANLRSAPHEVKG